MKVAEADILIVPGWQNAGPDHWLSRWQRSLSSARRVEQDDWENPARGPWVARLIEAVAKASRPVVLVAHSLGVATLAHATPDFPEGVVKGAFMVALPDVTSDAMAGLATDFAPLPEAPLELPTILVTSRTDLYCPLDVAEYYGRAWGSLVINAGDAGHLNTESGHGPWPEGSMTFARFLSRL